MNRKITIAVFVLTGLTAFSWQSTAQPTEESQDGSRGGGGAMKADTNGDGVVDDAEREASAQRRAKRQGQGGGQGNRPPPFKDANSDGLISEDEMSARSQKHFGRMDANGDGVIDRAEREALKQRFGEGRRSGGGSRGRIFKDANGDGVISADELPARARERISMMDTNGDGVIDAAEQAALKERRKAHNNSGGGGRGPRKGQQSSQGNAQAPTNL